MKFQVFHVNPREKLKKKDDNNDLSHFFIIFPIVSASTPCNEELKIVQITSKAKITQSILCYVML